MAAVLLLYACQVVSTVTGGPEVVSWQAAVQPPSEGQTWVTQDGKKTRWRKVLEPGAE